MPVPTSEVERCAHLSSGPGPNRLAELGDDGVQPATDPSSAAPSSVAPVIARGVIGIERRRAPGATASVARSGRKMNSRRAGPRPTDRGVRRPAPRLPRTPGDRCRRRECVRRRDRTRRRAARTPRRRGARGQEGRLARCVPHRQLSPMPTSSRLSTPSSPARRAPAPRRDCRGSRAPRRPGTATARAAGGLAHRPRSAATGGWPPRPRCRWRRGCRRPRRDARSARARGRPRPTSTQNVSPRPSNVAKRWRANGHVCARSASAPPPPRAPRSAPLQELGERQRRAGPRSTSSSGGRGRRRRRVTVDAAAHGAAQPAPAQEEADVTPVHGSRHPEQRRALSLISGPSVSSGSPRSSATRAAVRASSAGSLRLPAMALRRQNGQSVSTTSRSAGTKRATSGSARAFG